MTGVQTCALPILPGFEVIGTEELAEVNDVFARGGVLFRHGFDPLRDGCFKVREFEVAFASAMAAPHALAVTSGTAALDQKSVV